MSYRAARSIVAGGLAVLGATGAAAQTVVTPLYPGITHIKRTESLAPFQCPGCPAPTPNPRIARINILLVDLWSPAVHVKLTPPGENLPPVAPGSTTPNWPVVPFEVVRQRTLDFVNSSHAQAAINVHFFAPFPVPGGSTQSAFAYVIGLAASRGKVYSGFESAPIQSYAIVANAPGLNIDKDNNASIVHRDPASGVLFGTNGFITATNQNTGYLQTSGMDFTSSYGFDLGNMLPGAPDLGSVDVSFVGTWLNSRRVEQLPGLGSYNCVGLFGPTCGQPTPDWRHNVRMTWSSPQRSTTVSANWRYFGSAELSQNSSNEFLQGDPVAINARIAAYSYFDLAATWKWVDSVEFRAGINNVFDRDPPMIAAGLLSAFGNGNTYPGVYDPMGRLVYFGMTVEF